jgi:hypothetical protein
MSTHLSLWLAVIASVFSPTESRYSLHRETDIASTDQVHLRVIIRDTVEPHRGLPVRVVVSAADGSHPDGSGHGVYADGRFYAQGQFQVVLPPGRTRIELNGGPHVVPLTIQEDLTGGGAYRVDARLHRWLRPEDDGWYCGDNHVHALHDRHAAVQASLDYTALQGRAGGLNWIVEAGSNVPYERIDKLDTDTFLLRYATEQRPGAYVGHINTPGIEHPLNADSLRSACERPLPVQAIKQQVHARGGVAIHTHPLTPPHQLHWMGAAEFYSDMVMGDCADLLDIDSRATEWLWFMALNLGNRVGASASTDSALGRLRTHAPGDRRVYTRAETFTYAALIEGMRSGRTVATNGKALFPRFQIDAYQPGDVVKLTGPHEFTAQATIHTREGVRTAQLYRNGIRLWAEDLNGRQSPVQLNRTIKESETCWYVLRVEDARGNWAITSPIYFQADGPRPAPSHAILFEISNCTRFVELRKNFYGHIVATVAPGETMRTVELLRDGCVLKRMHVHNGNRIKDDKVPVTQLHGEYDEAWIWHPNPENAVHFQADVPIRESGWYAVRLYTSTGRVEETKGIQFDATHPQSRTISRVQVKGGGSSLELLGYGEERALSDIERPFSGDGWWYPRNSFWRMQVDFGQGLQTLGGGWEKALSLFR